ncbi:MAG: hypothetical protein JXQ83_06450 [Candidatus Glassbacteria bacterium]|nr:hypothetical protein [Candidatus Glassbacteria bacterium]
MSGLKTAGKDLQIVPRPATEGSPQRRCPQMSKAMALTGYRSGVGLEEGVRRTYEWYKANVCEGEEPCAR